MRRPHACTRYFAFKMYMTQNFAQKKISRKRTQYSLDYCLQKEATLILLWNFQAQYE